MYNGLAKAEINGNEKAQILLKQLSNILIYSVVKLCSIPFYSIIKLMNEHPHTQKKNIR